MNTKESENTLVYKDPEMLSEQKRKKPSEETDFAERHTFNSREGSAPPPVKNREFNGKAYDPGKSENSPH